MKTTVECQAASPEDNTLSWSEILEQPGVYVRSYEAKKTSPTKFVTIERGGVFIADPRFSGSTNDAVFNPCPETETSFVRWNGRLVITLQN